VGRDRRAEIRGRAKLDGLLEGQEARFTVRWLRGLDLQNATRCRRPTRLTSSDNDLPPRHGFESPTGHAAGARFVRACILLGGNASAHYQTWQVGGSETSPGGALTAPRACRLIGTHDAR
jgi:hypothetical protein